MALRAFHANPGIGGFGGESISGVLLLDPNKKGNIGSNVPESGDAICQIVKELTDNAIDASAEEQTNKKRVKVEILPCKSNENILQLTVSDNGCGMDDIQKCVNAFGSSKQDGTSNTAGRYGIGLTLCLLHAQRLVPNSYSCITSATKGAKHFTRALYTVDANGDSVRCDKKETIQKTSRAESGTCVSLLVPGGTMAELAWARLVNYFKRFELSPSIQCSLEVLAPTLSNVPLFVKIRDVQDALVESSTENDQQHEQWVDGFDDEGNENASPRDQSVLKRGTRATHEYQLNVVFNAAQVFLGGPLQRGNVASSIQPIRLGAVGRDQSQEPKMQVSMIVRPLETLPQSSGGNDEGSTATIQLVRMVNHIPLLDGAEAAACGLVTGLPNKDIWGSFGLRVENSNSLNQSCLTPTFEVHDSEQVALFFRVQTHKLWDQQPEDGQEEETNASASSKRKRSTAKGRTQQMPAKVRLARVLIVINIQAAPSSLPLPSLSKGRLPLNHGPIEKALHLGLRGCLRSLQVTNPGLLLTASQLRSAERETHHIPAIAGAVSRIISHMPKTVSYTRLISRIAEWENSDVPVTSQSTVKDLNDQAHLAVSIEKHISSTLLSKQQAKLASCRRQSRKRDQKLEETDFGDLDGFDTEQDLVSEAGTSISNGTSSAQLNTTESSETASDPLFGIGCEGESLPVAMLKTTTYIDADVDSDNEWW